uniref:HYPK_UBA domain-containing protein n=1 Tax=Meloidogyne hapla TaxID=6305 RepID=A0A1I8BXM2_MELHA
MVDSNTREKFVDAEKDADDAIVSPDSKELENISKMTASDQIIQRIDAMSSRVDELEKTVLELMEEAGINREKAND